MSIWEILWVLFVAICFVALIVSACSAGHGEDQDVSCCRNIAITVTGFILLCYFVGATREPYVPDPKFFAIWNRSGRTSSKAGWQITNYRQPDAHLPAEEYMMGVEMARSNACSAFNFSRAEDIALFKRCAHFFPEFHDIYREKHQNTVGVDL
jgi:hypothetical protein